MMDETLTSPAPAQPAEAPPDSKKEWTTPALKQLDLTETQESGGLDTDFFAESAP